LLLFGGTHGDRDDGSQLCRSDMSHKVGPVYKTVQVL
jgi:hypothetical protein